MFSNQRRLKRNIKMFKYVNIIVFNFIFMLRRFLHFDSFLISDFKKPTCFTFIFNCKSYPEDGLKINVKHVGFLKSDIRNESKFFIWINYYLWKLSGKSTMCQKLEIGLREKKFFQAKNDFSKILIFYKIF